MTLKCLACYEVAKDNGKPSPLTEAKPADLIFLGKGYCQEHYDRAAAAADRIVTESRRGRR